MRWLQERLNQRSGSSHPEARAYFSVPLQLMGLRPSSALSSRASRERVSARSLQRCSISCTNTTRARVKPQNTCTHCNWRAASGFQDTVVRGHAVALAGGCIMNVRGGGLVPSCSRPCKPSSLSCAAPFALCRQTGRDGQTREEIGLPLLWWPAAA